MRKEERGTKYSRWNEEGGEKCEVLGNGMREGERCAKYRSME